MSYTTVEVELENGHVRPANGEPLPAKAPALLTILTEVPPHQVEPGGPKSRDVMRNAVTPGPDEAHGPSIGELVEHLCGIGQGKYTDLSTNKAHMEGFGR